MLDNIVLNLSLSMSDQKKKVKLQEWIVRFDGKIKHSEISIDTEKLNKKEN
tara:strand:- start:734 stop:886 length:153 start_codon:yes stop_codon:yes gene_type:complete